VHLIEVVTTSSAAASLCGYTVGYDHESRLESEHTIDGIEWFTRSLG